VRSDDGGASVRPAEIRLAGQAGCRTARRLPPPGLPEYHRSLERLFASVHAKPRIAVECDSASSLITEVEAGRGVALSSTNFQARGRQTPALTPAHGYDGSGVCRIARASKGDVTPAGEKFCEILRTISVGATALKSKPASFFPKTKFVR